LWSVGVIAFMLLSSHRPFYSKQRRVMIDQIMRADYNLQGPGWGVISQEAKDFVGNLIMLDPKTRMNATSALVHKWLSVEFKPSDRKPTDAVLLAVDEGLVVYKDTSRFKKIALNVIAHRSSTEEILELRKCFDHFDSANDGIVSFDEFRLALQKANYPVETLKEIFESIVSQILLFETGVAT
jgi:calcium-dependent protein kinase